MRGVQISLVPVNCTRAHSVFSRWLSAGPQICIKRGWPCCDVSECMPVSDPMQPAATAARLCLCIACADNLVAGSGRSVACCCSHALETGAWTAAARRMCRCRQIAYHNGWCDSNLEPANVSVLLPGVACLPWWGVSQYISYAEDCVYGFACGLGPGGPVCAVVLQAVLLAKQYMLVGACVCVCL
jgi:hypothetical protein